MDQPRPPFVVSIGRDTARLLMADGTTKDIPVSALPTGQKPGAPLEDLAPAPVTSPQRDPADFMAALAGYAPPVPIAKGPSPRVTSDQDLALLDAVGQRYKALAPHMANAAVVQSPDPGDGRQLEFHHPASSENPVPGKMTFEMFKPFSGPERADAVAADALHYLGGRTNDDAGPPVDKRWQDMREQLWNSRTPAQRAVDQKNFEGDHEDGQTFDDWASRNRKDAYARAGIWPERNPDWNRGPDDPMGWTPEQQQHFAKMKEYLTTGK